jgi:hypothetical protein
MAKFLIGFGSITLILSIVFFIMLLFSSGDTFMMATIFFFGILNSGIAVGVGEILNKVNKAD